MTEIAGKAERACDGILQFSSALTMMPTPGEHLSAKLDRRYWPQVTTSDAVFGVLTREHIDATKHTLERILPGEKQQFILQPAYAPESPTIAYASDLAVGNPPHHTWLGNMSRHAPVNLPDEFHDSASDSFPILLNWDFRRPITPQSKPFIRTQWARGARSMDRQEDLPCDCNDYVVTGFSTDEGCTPLVDLRAFMARLYAQRRMRIFASDLSHRIYNVWLPPGLLRSKDEPGTVFAILPFVTRVRRPYRLTFGRTVTLSVVLVPISTSDSANQGPRKMLSAEIFRLVTSLEGDSCYVPGHAEDLFELVASPLTEYFRALKQQESLPVSSSLSRRASWAGDAATIRQWTELLFAAIVEPIFPKAGNSEGGSRSILADEILKAIRLNTLWSVLVLSPELEPFDSARDVIEDEVWWPSPEGSGTLGDRIDRGIPKELRGILDALIENERLPVCPSDRIDDIRCGSSSALMWGIVQRQCVVTAYSAQREGFPGSSALSLFGWTNQLLNGAACSRALMGTMAAEAEQCRDRDVSKLAKKSYELTLEIEEMFDLKIAWPEYELLYHRLKDRLGIADAFQRMKERQEQLSHHAEIVARTREERSIGTLQVLAAIFAIGIIAVGIEQVFQTEDVGLRLGWVSLGTAIAVALLASAVVYVKRER